MFNLCEYYVAGVNNNNNNTSMIVDKIMRKFEKNITSMRGEALTK